MSRRARPRLHQPGAAPYDLVVADPPYGFSSYSDKGQNRRPQDHYEWNMSDAEIMELGEAIRRVVADDSLLFLWCPFFKLDVAMDVGRSWGYKYVTGGVWGKGQDVPLTVLRDLGWQAQEQLARPAQLRRHIDQSALDRPHSGTGFYFRGNAEPILVFRLGKALGRPADKGVINLFLTRGPREEHSVKPEKLQDALERMYPAAKKLELFAQRRRVKWTTLGGEVTGNDIRQDLQELAIEVAFPQSESAQRRWKEDGHALPCL
jgi:N6-adenosine-specific RNA methylase IME4